MKGTWFYIWQMPSVGRYQDLIRMLAPWKDKITGFYIKLLDGTSYHNRFTEYMKATRDDAYLKEWIAGMRAAGYQVEGWHYVYPSQTSLQGDMADERRQKLDLHGWIVNAEKEWNNVTGANKKVDVYLGKLHKQNFEVGFTSYRYPKYFPDFSWGAWLNNPRIEFNSPQVYWIGSHNPIPQMQMCEEQYKDLGYNVPIIPSASSFAEGTWEPTQADLAAMQSYAISKYGGIVWWSLDKIIKGQRWDWMEAICGEGTTPPPPAGIVPLGKVVVNTATLNIRTNTGTIYPDLGDLHRGDIVPYVEERDGWLRIDGWIYKGLTKPG